MADTDESLKIQREILAELKKISSRLDEISGYGDHTIRHLQGEIQDAARMLRGTQAEIYAMLNTIRQALVEES